MFKIASRRPRTPGDESRPNGEGSIFPYRNGFAACVWITTPLGKRQRKYVYGRTREIVHGRWVELARKAARGPVVTKVPTIGQFIRRWLEETVAPNLAPLTYATYETHVKNYIEPESMPCGLIVFASQMSSRGSMATSCSLSMAEVATDMVCCSSQWVPCHFCRQIGLEPSYLGTSAEPPDKTCKRC